MSSLKEIALIKLLKSGVKDGSEDLIQLSNPDTRLERYRDSRRKLLKKLIVIQDIQGIEYILKKRVSVDDLDDLARILVHTDNIEILFLILDNIGRITTIHKFVNENKLNLINALINQCIGQAKDELIDPLINHVGLTEEIIDKFLISYIQYGYFEFADKMIDEHYPVENAHLLEIICIGAIRGGNVKLFKRSYLRLKTLNDIGYSDMNVHLAASRGGNQEIMLYLSKQGIGFHHLQYHIEKLYDMGRFDDIIEFMTLGVPAKDRQLMIQVIISHNDISKFFSIRLGELIGMLNIVYPLEVSNAIPKALMSIANSHNPTSTEIINILMPYWNYKMLIDIACEYSTSERTRFIAKFLLSTVLSGVNDEDLKDRYTTPIVLALKYGPDTFGQLCVRLFSYKSLKYMVHLCTHTFMKKYLRIAILDGNAELAEIILGGKLKRKEDPLVLLNASVRVFNKEDKMRTLALVKSLRLAFKAT